MVVYRTEQFQLKQIIQAQIFKLKEIGTDEEVNMFK